MEKITFAVNKEEITKVGNRYLYGKNTTTRNKGEMIEDFLRKYYLPETEWYKKDSVDFETGSDIEVNDMKISVKSGEFTLTEKIYTFEKNDTEKIRMVEEYAKRTHSNTVAYGKVAETETEYIFTIYLITIMQFVEIVKRYAVFTSITGTKRMKIKVKRDITKYIEQL